VSVAGEHHVDEREAGVLDDRIDEVGLVAHEEDRGVGHGRDREIEVAGRSAGIAGSREPEVVVAALDGDVAIDEDRGAVSFEGVDDLLGADCDVVVAEYGVALWGLEGGEDFRANADGFERERRIAGTAADEVSGEEDELRVEGINAGDGVLEEPRLGIFLEMDVGELYHVEALKGVRKLVDGERTRDDLELVAGVKT